MSGHEVPMSIELETRLPFLMPSWYFGLLFKQGWVFGRTTGREFTDIDPYPLGSLAALSNLADWTALPEIGVLAPRRYTEPQKKELFYQYFWGVTPPKTRVFTQFPPRVDLRILIERLNLKGDIGYVSGRDSSYWNPSPKTEIWSVVDLHPQFQCYNPTNDAIPNVLMRFAYCKYPYRLVKEKPLITDFVEDRRKVHKYIMGPPDAPADIPDWLKDVVGEEALAHSREVAGLT